LGAHHMITLLSPSPLESPQYDNWPACWCFVDFADYASMLVYCMFC